MQIKNTSDIPTEKLREIVNFVKPEGISKFSINFTKTKYGRGGGRSWPEEFRILIRVAQAHKEHKYPMMDNNKKGAYLDYLLLSREEGVVQVTAHEFYHLKQHVYPRCHRVWGSKGKQSERACDAYGIKMVRKWRRAHTTVPEITEQIWNVIAPEMIMVIA